MSGQPRATRQPPNPLTVKETVSYDTLLNRRYYPAGSNVLVVRSHLHRLQFCGIDQLVTGNRVSEFLIETKHEDGHLIRIPAQGPYFNIYMTMLAFIFNARDRKTGALDAGFAFPDAYPAALYPPDFAATFFELLQLTPNRNPEFRQQVVKLLDGFGPLPVEDRLGILHESITDISARTLIFKWAVANNKNFADILPMLYAMQSSVDPSSQIITGVSPWPMTAVPPGYKSWTKKSANAYVRDHLLLDVLRSHVCYATTNESTAASAQAVHHGLIPFVVGTAVSSNASRATYSFCDMPIAENPSPVLTGDAFLERRYFERVGGAKTFSTKGRSVLTIGALSLRTASAANVFDIGIAPRAHHAIVFEFTFHPLMVTSQGLHQVQLLQNPPRVKDGEAFCPTERFSGRAGWANAVGFIVNASTTDPLCDLADCPFRITAHHTSVFAATSRARAVPIADCAVSGSPDVAAAASRLVRAVERDEKRENMPKLAHDLKIDTSDTLLRPAAIVQSHATFGSGCVITGNLKSSMGEVVTVCSPTSYVLRGTRHDTTSITQTFVGGDMESAGRKKTRVVCAIPLEPLRRLRISATSDLGDKVGFTFHPIFATNGPCGDLVVQFTADPLQAECDEVVEMDPLRKVSFATVGALVVARCFPSSDKRERADAKHRFAKTTFGVTLYKTAD